VKIIKDNETLAKIDLARGDFNFDSGSIVYNIFENKTIDSNINYIEVNIIILWIK